MSNHETLLRGILYVLPGVCKNGPCGPNFRAPLAPNSAKIRPKGIFFAYFAKGFPWIQMKIVF